MSIFKGNMNSANMFTANDDIRGLRLIAPGALPSFWGVECADGSDWYFWVNDSDNLVMHTAAPTSTYDSVGTVIGGATTAGANTALSNLATTTAVSSHLIPGSSKTLGDSSNLWLGIYGTTWYGYSNTTYITGANGSFTITGSLTTSGTITLGADGTDVDLICYGETTGQYAKWDGNAYSNAGLFHLRDNVRLGFGAASATTGDIQIYGDGTDLVIEAATDDVVIRSGAASDVDWVWESKSSSTNDACWTADVAIFQLAGAAKLHFGGTTALDGGTDGFTIVFDESNTLNIDPKTAYDVVRIGETTVGKFHLDGLNYDIYWDGETNEFLFNDNAKLVFGGTSDDLVMKSTGTYALWTFGAVTNKISIQAYAAQTASVLEIDGSTNDWDGSDNVGMLHLKQDAAMNDAGATMLYLGSSGTPIASSEGFMMRMEDSGSNTSGAFAIELYSAANHIMEMHTGAVGVVPLTIAPHTNATASAIKVDAYTDGFVGAANTGLVNIAAKGTLAATTASLLHINPTGAYAANGEGGALFINDDKTASSTNYSVYVNSAAVNCMKLETGTTTMSPLVIEPVASSTAPGIKVDGDANGWTGATGVGLVDIDNDTKMGHAAASLLFLDNTGAAAANAAGICLRMVDSGTAATAGTGYIAYMESTSNSGLKIATGATGTTALTLLPHTSATADVLFIDGDTNNFTGASGAAMLHIDNDSKLGHAAASLVFLDNTGAAAASAHGTCLRVIDSGTAATAGTGYVSYITSTNNNPMYLGTGAVGGTALTLRSHTSATGKVLYVDGDTNGWVGAASTGQVHIDADTQLASGTASLLYIDNTGGACATALGTCLRIVDSGAVATVGAAYVSYISSTNNNALLVTGGATGTTPLTARCHTSAIVDNVYIDGDSNGFVGASNVALLHVDNDVKMAHANASLLFLDNTGPGRADALGSCLRVVDTGTVATGTPAYIGYIKSTSNYGLFVGTGAVASTPLTVQGHTSATADVLTVDGDTLGWVGATGAAMVHVDNDVKMAHANASLLFLDNTGQARASAAGSCLRVVDTGSAGTDGTAYVSYISSTSNNPLYLATGATGTTALTAVCHTNATANVIFVDGDTNNWVGAASTGMVHIDNDTQLAAGTASLLYLDNTGGACATALGTCLRIVDSGAAATVGSGYVTYVSSTNNNAMLLTGGATSTLPLTVRCHTSAVADTVYIDGDTNGYVGADAKSLLHIDNDTQMGHANASLLFLDNTGAAKASALGNCLRIVDSGTAATATPAYVSYINSTNNSGLLVATGAVGVTPITARGHTNATANVVEIDGDTNGFVGAAGAAMLNIDNDVQMADATASLLYLDNSGGAAASAAGTCLRIVDTGVVATAGTAYVSYISSTNNDALKLSTGAVGSTALTIQGHTNATGKIAYVNGDANNWVGAGTTGMLHIDNDTKLASATASLLYLDNTGAAYNSAHGTCLRIVDSGTAATAGTGYVAYISSSGNEALHVDSGKVQVDEYITANLGIQHAAVAITANLAGDGSAIIPDGTSFITVSASDSDAIITLPTPTPGNVVWLTESGTGYEIRSSSPASVYINNGAGTSAESAVAASKTVRMVCINATHWLGTVFAASGAESALEVAAN